MRQPGAGNPRLPVDQRTGIEAAGPLSVADADETVARAVAWLEAAGARPR